MPRRWATLALLIALGCDGAQLGVRRDGGSLPSDGGSPADDAASWVGMDGGGTPADAGSMPDAQASQCDDPPGSPCNPIVIDSFPFRHEGDTSLAAIAEANWYSCAPSTDEAGPEVHYEIRLPAASRLSLALEEGSGVDVDLHVLRSADATSCMARANTTLETALGAGTWRLIVDTFRTYEGAYVLTVDAAEPTATPLGTMWNSFYFVSDENDYESPQDVPIYDSSCQELARVRAEFHDSVCIEGSGRLTDGRIINYASSCTTSCPSAGLCGSRDYRICYTVLDPARYPWGMGAGGRALVPDQSMAVDRNFIPLGSWVYFQELDGVIPPGSSTPHNGCMRADDVGGAVDGNQFDFFAATRTRWLEWERLLPTRSTLHASLDDPRCYPSP